MCCSDMIKCVFNVGCIGVYLDPTCTNRGRVWLSTESVLHTTRGLVNDQDKDNDKYNVKNDDKDKALKY